MNMIAVQSLRVDYQEVRSRIKCAFAWSESPFCQTPGADFINNGADHQIGYSCSHYPGQSWNTRTRASETRRAGRSRELWFDQTDNGSESMRYRIGRLQRANQAAVSYFYDSNSVAGKHPAKSLVWAAYLPSMSGCSAETKATALNMLDHLLPTYRYLMLQGEAEKIKQPWKLFPKSIKSDEKNPKEAEEDKRKKWYATYHRHWKGLQQAIERLDHGILELLDR